MSNKSVMERLREDAAAGRKEHDLLGVKVYTTRISLAEQIAVRDREPENRAAYMVELLLAKCTLADGTAAFTRDDKDELMQKVAGDRLTPLVAAITGPTVEDQAKN